VGQVVDHSWFKPLPAQLAFLQTRSKETVYAGGVGSGKTLSGGMRCLTTSMLYPGTVGLVGRQSYRALEDTTKKVILEGDDKPAIIDPALVKKWSASDLELTLKNGSTILFRSFQDHSVEKLLSLNLGWFYIDELTETTLKVWTTLLGRLRHPAGPRVGWGTTNPNGHDWVWSRWHPDSPDAILEQARRQLFIAPTLENMHLPQDYIDLLMAQPEEWKKRFVYCSFDTASGMIWSEYSRDVHVYPHHPLPYTWKRLEALDHGRRNPTAYLQGAIDEDGNVWVHDEYYSPGLIKQHSIAIKTLRGSHRGFASIKADPSVFVKGFNDRSVADEYLAEGIHLTPASNAVSAGLTRVSQYLTRRPDQPFPHHHPLGGTLGRDAAGAPRLFISDKCVNLLREITDYVWKDLSPTQEEQRDQPEEPRKKNDHACDALRYLVATLPSPTGQPRFRDRNPQLSRMVSAGLLDRSF
jgi:hypothetical protein